MLKIKTKELDENNKYYYVSELNERINLFTLRKIVSKNIQKSWGGVDISLFLEDIDNERVNLKFLENIINILNYDIETKKYKFNHSIDWNRNKYRWVFTQLKSFFENAVKIKIQLKKQGITY